MGYGVTPRGGRAVNYKGTGGGVGYNDVPTTGTNVKGAWTELVSALPLPIDGFTVCMGGAGQAYYQVDIGVGAAGAEVPIVQNILFRTANDFGANGRYVDFPYPLPAGARIVARQANSVGTARSVRTSVIARAARGPGRTAPIARCTTYGASAFSAGTDVDPGGTVGAYGAWVQFAAALTYPVRRIVLTMVNQAGQVFASYKFDIGVGAAGAEVVVAKDLPNHNADIGQGCPPGVLWADVNIPAGARLAIRMASDSNAANRIMNMTAICQG